MIDRNNDCVTSNRYRNFMKNEIPLVNGGCVDR